MHVSMELLLLTRLQHFATSCCYLPHASLREGRQAGRTGLRGKGGGEEKPSLPHVYLQWSGRLEGFTDHAAIVPTIPRENYLPGGTGRELGKLTFPTYLPAYQACLTLELGRQNRHLLGMLPVYVHMPAAPCLHCTAPSFPGLPGRRNSFKNGIMAGIDGSLKSSFALPS